MNGIPKIANWLKQNSLCGLLVPSTDEFLSEFSPPHSKRLRWATGYTGSVGLLIALQDKAALFVDGRYTLQAGSETQGAGLDVLGLSDLSLQDWLKAHLRRTDRLAVDPGLHSYVDFLKLRRWITKTGADVVVLSSNPIDELWRAERPSSALSPVGAHQLSHAGRSSVDKCAEICRALTRSELDGYLVCDPEDVAWLLNVRANDWPYAPVCLSHVLLEANGHVVWFVDSTRLSSSLASRLEACVDVVSPDLTTARLTQYARGRRLGANLTRTPYRWADLVMSVGTIEDMPLVERLRWKKCATEIEGARHAHYLDGIAVIRFAAWLARTVKERRITELEASSQLEDLRRASSEYRGPSMPFMSASGKSGACPHYIPSERSNRALNEHAVYWMDSGGHYPAGTTDNTISIALGNVEPRHRLAHTLVLKGFIALATARFPKGTLASQLDSFARRYLWEHGMDYAHGTSHGVGSVLNIHEGPIIGKYHIHTPLNAPIEAGMILSNEPAYYAADDFGIRIESHILAVPSRHDGFLEFETLSRLPIDHKLVDLSLLTPAEKRWLSAYHHKIEQDYVGKFDEVTQEWLNSQVEFFARG